MTSPLLQTIWRGTLSMTPFAKSSERLWSATSFLDWSVMKSTMGLPITASRG